MGDQCGLPFVGVVGFEPTTPCSQSRCANRAALHPENHLAISSPEPYWQSNDLPTDTVWSASSKRDAKDIIFII